MAPPASVGIDTFPNKKPKPVSGIDPVTTIGFPDIDGGGGGGDFSSPEVIYSSLSLTATRPINKGFLRRFTPFDRNNNGGTFRLREDDINGAVLNTFTYPAGNSTLSFIFTNIITNQPVGIRAYVYTREQNTPTTGFTRLHSGATTLSYIVDIENTKNTNIING